jgi:hypothetical protein
VSDNWCSKSDSARCGFFLHIFLTSPSTAPSVLLDRNSNGREIRRDEGDRTLKENQTTKLSGPIEQRSEDMADAAPKLLGFGLANYRSFGQEGFVIHNPKKLNHLVGIQSARVITW